MTLAALLSELHRLGVTLSRQGDGLVVQAPSGAVTPGLRVRLAQHKPALLDWLSKGRPAAVEDAGLPNCAPDPAHRQLPFPLLDMQLGFYMADDPYMEFHVRPHYYMEKNRETLDVDRYERAWNKALERHWGEIVVVTPEGQLRVVEELPTLRIQRIDLREHTPEVAHRHLEAIRAQMMRAQLPLDRWPWVDLRVSTWLDRGRLQHRIHYNHNNFFSDGFGTAKLLQEIDRYERDPEIELPPLALSLRDAALCLDDLAKSPAGQRARAYWEARLPSLPNVPPLPLAHLDRRVRSELNRRERFMEATTWAGFRERARQFGLTPSNAILTAYAEILSAWGNTRHFVLSNMMIRRLAVHPEIRSIVGNFASVYPLEVDFRPDDRFVDRARRLQEQALRDACHLEWGGMQVMQTLNRQRGGFGETPIPFVVSSGLFMEGFERADFSCLETSQVMLDHQFWETSDGRLFCVWDLLEAFFLPGVVDAMWDAYARLIEQLGVRDELWTTNTLALLPEEQAARRPRAVVDPEGAGVLRLEDYLARAVRTAPTALVGSRVGPPLTFADLDRSSAAIAKRLRRAGARPGDLVPVMAPRCGSLVQAVYGVLRAGCAYVPMDPALPLERQRYLLEDSGARLALVDSGQIAGLTWPSSVTVLGIDEAMPSDDAPGAGAAPSASTTDLAYVIYTSGSTGKPKGVMIDHRGAINTIEDVNARFEITAGDCLFGVSSFSFDLSVYDLFGSVAAGARLVYPEPGRALNPAHWIEVMAREGVTVWNSAPPLATLLVEAAEDRSMPLSALRLVLLSGDWIPVDLPDRLRAVAPGARIVSLGGATEASIWSICYPIDAVDPTWTSIPYGFPMRNQPWDVLDAWGRPAPEWTVGELVIGGLGLAQGYWGDPRKTERAFGAHAASGPLCRQRSYRTGDMGRYREDGAIEFMGRRDTQVKVQGHRIELAEVESELLQCPGVQAAIASAQRESTRDAARLVAHVVLKDGASFDGAAIQTSLSQVLPRYMVPTSIAAIPTLPITLNGKLDRAALPRLEEASSPRAERRQLPRTDTESALLAIWRRVLAAEEIDLAGDFFEMGGQSFEAVRITGLVQQELGRTLTLGTIWEQRSIEAIASLLDHCGAEPVRRRVVLRESGGRPDLLLLHPAGGQVMAYRGLAERLDRRVTAFEAVGLRGGEDVPSTIPALVGQYVNELLRDAGPVPRLLAGWSSGAILAFEAAHQLLVRGHPVDGVVLLDCPVPHRWEQEVSRAELLAWFLEDLALDLPQGYLLPVDRLLSGVRDDAQMFARLGAQLRADGLTSEPDWEALLPIFRVFAAVVRGTRCYRPSMLPVRLLVLRANTGTVSEFASHPCADRTDWGWAAFSSRGTQSSWIGGSHHTLLTDEQVGPTARLIESWLDACRSSAADAVASRR
ncbi:amino acid adenylation domain-containing protein [Verminephrobacter aporrectodeae subsp. tuberculatae]|uniref:non-ribosomal peptide synthetase n=1 Tax=Verminephrobacter aporrectodeae TaxID=1110389 RepID=UPI002244978C|nr:amino acid adenylation domain-containing protein [Verminephrobacter aporrectodeae]MCW8198695.1 amino acid adenylation domain-containing protein [Verminephrobacter aporrectodeae subsp. tuberculatae]